jgi:hypothetical protein
MQWFGSAALTTRACLIHHRTTEPMTPPRRGHVVKRLADSIHAALAF